MKTVFVAFYEAYPPDSGAAVVSYSVARFMPGECLLIQIASHRNRKKLDSGLTVESLAIPADSPFEKAMYTPARVRAITRAVSRFGGESVVLEGASWAMYHLLLLYSLRRHLPDIKIFYHSHNVEYDLRRSKNGWFIASLTKWAEGRLLRGVDRIFAVSPVDARRFRELYQVNSELLPNGVDVQRFIAIRDADVLEMRKRFEIGPHTILFMGLYAYGPNTEAVEFLIHDVMPRLLKIDPDAQLVVTGGEVPYQYSWLKNPGMLPFDDLPALIRACSISTAPIFSGSGTRLKIVECMAAGIPVVSTPKGAEGLVVVDGQSILLAIDGEGFATAICRLWENSDLYHSLTATALKIVSSRYDWPVCLENLINLY